MGLSKKQIALIHTAKRALGLTEIEYREMLAAVGVSSSKQLSYNQFEELLREFKRAGFTPICRPRHDQAIPKDKMRFINKIEIQCRLLGFSRAYADGIAAQMFGIPKLVWLDLEQLDKVVAALAIHIERHRKNSESNIVGQECPTPNENGAEAGHSCPAQPSGPDARQP